MAEFLQQIINGVAWGSIYALIALGYTMVYGVLRLINFAHGDVYMIGAMVGYYATRALGWNKDPSPLHFVVILLVSMIACALLGFLIERGAYRPLRARSKLTALITAIGVSLLLENGGQLFFVRSPDGLDISVRAGPAGYKLQLFSGYTAVTVSAETPFIREQIRIRDGQSALPSVEVINASGATSTRIDIQVMTEPRQ